MIQDPSDPTIRQLDDLNGEKERPKRKGQDIRFTDNEERFFLSARNQRGYNRDANLRIWQE